MGLFTIATFYEFLIKFNVKMTFGSHIKERSLSQWKWMDKLSSNDKSSMLF